VFPEALSRYAEQSLIKMGVEVRTGIPVTACNENGIAIGDEFVSSRTVIWAAGVQASNAAAWVGAEKDRAGRAVVQPDLTVGGKPEIFIIGDTASVKAADGTPVPGVAPAAKQQGKYVASVIEARRLGIPTPSAFRYRHLGNLATIGPNSAVIDFGKIRLKGGIAWWIWGLAHIYFLIGTRSRLAVGLSWLWIFVSGHHSARLITQKETLKDEV
jgi:NADH dehydrogenase